MKNRTLAVSTVVLLGVLVAIAAPEHHAPGQPGDVTKLNVTIHEWDVPTKGAHPHDPAVGHDGALWFTEQMTNKIGRLDPTTGKFKEYPLATDKNSGPHGLIADRYGNIWFTANFGGYIGKLDPNTGKVTEYKMPSEKADDPHTAVFDTNGILWFTVQGGNMVGRLDPKSGKIELKEVPTESALPYGIQINSKGVPIFCELGTNKMASIDPATLKITEYLLPESARPRRLAIARDDTVYFTDFKSGHLGTLNTTTRVVKIMIRPVAQNRILMESRSRPMEWCGIANRGLSPTRLSASILRRRHSRGPTYLPEAEWCGIWLQLLTAGCISRAAV